MNSSRQLVTALSLFTILSIGCQGAFGPIGKTKVPAPGTSTGETVYYQQQQRNQISDTNISSQRVAGSDTWSPRARDSIRVATEPTIQPMSYESQDTTDSTSTSSNTSANGEGVIRIPVRLGTTETTGTVTNLESEIPSTAAVTDSSDDAWTSRTQENR